MADVSWNTFLKISGLVLKYVDIIYTKIIYHRQQHNFEFVYSFLLPITIKEFQFSIFSIFIIFSIVQT